MRGDHQLAVQRANLAPLVIISLPATARIDSTVTRTWSTSPAWTGRA